MKRRINDYKTVNILPKNALSVADYARKLNCTTPYIYKLWREHLSKKKEINFEIVMFSGINFIVEN
jgi:hypothetical protein